MLLKVTEIESTSKINLRVVIRHSLEVSYASIGVDQSFLDNFFRNPEILVSLKKIIAIYCEKNTDREGIHRGRKGNQEGLRQGSGLGHHCG